jgi:hypothetical protein
MNQLTRREWLRLSSAGVLGAGLSGWLPALAAETAADPKRKRSCILLWMDGGPSQIDTFDLKPGTANGGPFQEAASTVPGVKISEHLPKVAGFMQHMAVIRSMSTREGEHERATQLLHTGYLIPDRIQYPSLGALLGKELSTATTLLPSYVSIIPNLAGNAIAHDPGFLGPVHAPFLIFDAGATMRPQAGQGTPERILRVQNLEPPRSVAPEHLQSRVDLLREMEQRFVARHQGTAALGHQAAYERAVRLARTEARLAFNVEEETDSVRDAYGRSLFGQGCLLARRLVERGVPFVEVALGGLNGGALGWDTHTDNFESVKRLSQVLDPAWGSLMSDLKERGLLDSTLIVWMGEFGRTPGINGNRGRDHFPNAWSTVLAGGGIKGGQAIGRTSANGMAVEDRPVTVPDLLATICRALGIDPAKHNDSNVGRPIRIVDRSAKPIQEVIA